MIKTVGTLTTIGMFDRVSFAGNKAPKPNILLIHTDQHRMECLGAYGNKDIQTPNIDKLASEGVLYHQSFCTLPICAPSRHSLISGMYVHEHKGWINGSTLNPEIRTFPDILRQAGYKTAAIGKMHFTPTYLDVGFERLILAEQAGPGRWDDDYHRDLMKNGLVDRLDLEDQVGEYRKNANEEYFASYGTRVTNLPDEFYSTNWIARRALQELQEWDESGNMLMVGFIKPHHPFDPPQKWAELYAPDSLDLLPGWIEESLPYDLEENKGYFPNKELKKEAVKKTMAYYYAAITQIDYEVGRMVDLLKSKGLYDNTMIIYTSDHGEHMGYHHQLLKHGYLYESIMKVPLIIKFPEGLNRGLENNDLVSNIDVAPTILKVAGLPAPETMSGQDLSQNNIKREYVFAHNEMARQAMARSKEFKLILNYRGRSLFFDLRNDPLEMNNLYEEPSFEAKIREFREAIYDWQGGDTIQAEIYLDYDAPIIEQPDVPNRYDHHREEMQKYFKKKMLS